MDGGAVVAASAALAGAQATGALNTMFTDALGDAQAVPVPPVTDGVSGSSRRWLGTCNRASSPTVAKHYSEQ